MAVVLTWFRVFKLSWWRRCKACHCRAAKCICKRPSLIMEQILYVEERNNKFGARNFSHVSDTAVTASTHSVATTVASGPSFGEDYRAGDFYRSTQQQPQGLPMLPPSTSSLSADQSVAPTSTALVRKNSGKMVPHASARPFHDDLGYGYSPYYTNDYGTQPRPSRPRRLPASSRVSNASTTSRSEETSLQLYSRRGRPTRSNSHGSSSTRVSNADSLIVRPSNSSSIRASCASDRMSLDNNMGSYNPCGRFYDGGAFTSSIQEDEDDTLHRLHGLLQMPSPASSTSTIMERSRYAYY